MQWADIDRQLAANITCPVTRRASTTQGTSLLRAAAAAFPDVAVAIKALKATVMAAIPPGGADRSAALSQGHLATCHGAVCGLLGLSVSQTRVMFLFITMRDMVSAAVRLNVVGPLRGGALQHTLSTRVPALVARTRALAVQQSCQVVPLLSIIAGAHDRLYSRMFNS